MSVASRLLNFKKGELPLAVLSAMFFFSILAGYNFLRPVREAMGVARGMDTLRWLFLATCVVSLVLVVVFGSVVSRVNRRKFIPIGYLFVIVCLFGFAGLLIFDAMNGGGFIGDDVGTTFSVTVGYIFYMWLSSINLFVNSLFWAFMVDIFNLEQGKRIFAFIGIGGTLGAIFGSTATRTISGMTESAYLPPGLMLTGAAFFGMSIIIMLTLDRRALASEHSHLTKDSSLSNPTGEENIGGKAWDGLKAISTSTYLMGIAGYIVLMAISNTLIYFTQAGVVLEGSDSFSELVDGFALFDMVAQTATLITQIFITTRLIKKLGVGMTLAILPMVTVAGFVVLAIWPIYGVMAIFQALHRATRYAISRPARETLFSVLPASEKYKAKPAIDVFLYRGGDAAGMGIESMLSKLGSGLAGVAGGAAVLAAGWTVLCIALGRKQMQMAEEQEKEQKVAGLDAKNAEDDAGTTIHS